MAEPLPVPAQLEAQLDKCKTVRNAAEYYKPRNKTAEVRQRISWRLHWWVAAAAAATNL